MNPVKAGSEELGVCTNISNTKVMVTDRAGHLPEYDGLNEYEKFDTFDYLGCTIKANG